MYTCGRPLAEPLPDSRSMPLPRYGVVDAVRHCRHLVDSPCTLADNVAMAV